MKNCDQGLENPARGRRPQAEGSIFKSEVSFSLYGPTLSRQITYLFFSSDKLAYNWVYITLLLSWITCRIQTIVKNLTNERASKLRHYTKKDICIKEQIYFELLYVSCI